MFIDDPKAEEFDKNGSYIPNYSNNVMIGKQLTLEEAQIIWDRDMRKDKLRASRERRNSNRYKVI
tara:strand:- start:125 stop:319 length:195 start_codon:yes stop_codon:yes gene_type:complete